MGRLHGYGPRGERLVDALPYGHWKTTTFVGGLTLGGFVAPMVLDGPMTGDAFAAYVEQVLAREVRPGDLVVLDNLSAHKTAGVRAAFARRGIAHLYLPPYSPDLNPIENLWSKVKGKLRSIGARTVETVHDAVGVAFATVTAADCVGFFRHCGYLATDKGAPL